MMESNAQNSNHSMMGMQPMMGMGMPMNSNHSMPMMGMPMMGMNPMMMGMGMNPMMMGMNPMMMGTGMNPMMGMHSMMPGMRPMTPMQVRMVCEMGRDGVICKMMPMEGQDMAKMKDCCDAMMSMMAMGAPVMMMCNGVPMMMAISR